MMRSVIRRLWLAAGCIGAMLPLSLNAQTVRPPVEPPRITAPIDDADRVALKGNTHPLAQARFDRGQASSSMSTGRVALLLKRSPARQQALSEYLAGLQDPRSPAYHKWLTPSQYGETFGLAASDIDTVERWLESHGLKVEKLPQARNVIQFSGSVDQIQAAFHTPIHSFTVNGQHHYANLVDPQIPAALAPVIAGIGPLNDFHPHPLAKLDARARYDASTDTLQPQLTLFDGAGDPYLFVDPADAATIYNTPNAKLNANYTGTTYDGTGVSIGIVGDSNVDMDGVTNYRLAFLGETAANVNIPTVVVDGDDPGVNGDTVEAELDNEVAGGLAPKAKLYFYVSANTGLQSGLFNAIFRALDDNTVSILNISFGGCEAEQGSSTNALILEGYEQAAAQGISVTVSSGDSGSAGCDYDGLPQAQSGLAVNALASTPYNIAVGGTDYDILPSNFTDYVQDKSGRYLYSGSAPYYRTALKYIPEEPWNDSTSVNTDTAANVALSNQGVTDIVAGGGGASSVYAKPPFQTALTPDDHARDLPDVSFLAGNDLYAATWTLCAASVVIVDCQTENGQLAPGAFISGVGGTSAAAPAFAGMLALVEQKAGTRLGQADSVLYQLAQAKYKTVFHDVTTGDNSVVCAAGSPDCGKNGFMTGYDAAAGYDQASGLGSVDVASMVDNWDSVSLAPTTTTLDINASTAPVNVTHGTSLLFQASVAPATAGGVVGIIDTANEVTGEGAQNNGQLAIPLSHGSGSATYNGLPGGSYTVYARYGGDTANAASSSSPALQVNVSPENSTTSLGVHGYAVDAYATPISGTTSIPYGSYIVADAQIYGTAEGSAATQGIATGSVAFLEGGKTLGHAQISSSNQASYPAILETAIPPLPTAYSIGQHTFLAKYAGDPSYNPSSSRPVSFTVVKGNTTLYASAGSTTITSLQSTNVLLGVDTTSIGAIPTGTVTLSEKGATLATTTGISLGVGGYGEVLGEGRLPIAGNQLAPGTNILTVTYSGDSNYNGSSTTVTINVTASNFSLTSAGSMTVIAGASAKDTITARPTNGFLGFVDLSCAVTASPDRASSPVTCTIPASVNITGNTAVSASLSVSSTTATTPGTYTVTVTGKDAATGKLTASTPVAVSVTAPAVPPGFTLTNSGNLTIKAGATTGNSSTISVSPSGGFTGVVNLVCAVSAASGSPASSPTCSVPSTVSIAGSNAASAALTVTTQANTSALVPPLYKYFVSTGGAAIAAVFFFGIPERRRSWRSMAGLFVILVSLDLLGCGTTTRNPTGGSGGGTTPGTYAVSVSASDAATGKITTSTTVSVTVN